ncbi:SMI1/KNR4 family protein [Vagococcus sp. WN89Y]|uniref:SMI1/KNR4 family protein n=1 Tax=Vagococcus sp. WN89Y TaxID=3457258 RepID=UPI003FCCF6CF
MKENLDSVISELIRLSGNERNNLPLPDDDLIAQYEEDTGFIFSDNYKKVLKEVGNIFYGSIELLSLSKDKKYYGELTSALSDAREQGLPETWLPICEDNGSYYCIDPEGIIRYWTTDGYSNEQWPNLASWIKEVWIEGN